MGNFGKAVRAGLDAARGHYADAVNRPPGDRFVVGGKVVRCASCDGERFELGKALLNSTALTLAKLDWLDHSASILTCVNCSEIRWFGFEPTVLDDVDVNPTPHPDTR